MPVCGASPRPVKAKHGMVVSAEAHATRVGVEILRRGGNAVDAAVAVGFALAVTFPQAGNLGGGGFMVIRLADGTTTTIDYREKAPGTATRDMFIDPDGSVNDKSRIGHLASGVPGSVAGLLYALRRYGTMKRADILAPAIRLAEKGFRLEDWFVASISAVEDEFKKFPATSKIFLPKGRLPEEGYLLRQKDLSNTLRRIQKSGADGFYKGKTADLIVAEMRRGGGLISHDDLRKYKAVERPAIRGSYRGYEILSMGPPSSGGITLLQILNLVEHWNIKEDGFASSRAVFRLAEAMKVAYADRAQYLGDSDFVSVPVEWLISKEYARARVAEIVPFSVRPSDSVSFGIQVRPEGTQTTHYSIVDMWGNAVSVTTTINSLFGSMVVVDGAGFFLNNEMDDFALKPGVPNMYGLVGSTANQIHPGKRMLSSMTPVIVLKNSKPWIVAGSPGGSTIITTVAQILVNCIDYGMNIAQANYAPRIHHQWRPDTLFLEPSGFPVDVTQNLRAMGYHLIERNGTQGRVDAIMIDSDKKVLWGSTDPRGNGLAEGY